jgi:hypothetical protein
MMSSIDIIGKNSRRSGSLARPKGSVRGVMTQHVVSGADDERKNCPTCPTSG